MKNLIKHGHDLCHLTIMAASRTQIDVCDTVTWQIHAGPVKIDENQHDEREDIEKKVEIFLHFEWYSS